MAIIIFILSIPLVFAACVLLTMTIGLTTLYQAIVTGVVMLVYLAVFVAWLIRYVRRLGRRFDDVMKAAGLAFKQRKGAACCYGDSLTGREANASVTPAYRFQPWRIDISVSASSACRIALGSTRPVLDCRQAERLILDDGPLENAHIHADDPDDARRRLADSDLLEPLRSLVEQLGSCSSWELYLQPDRVWLRARTYHIRGTAITAWLDAMPALAEACERTD